MVGGIAGLVFGQPSAEPGADESEDQVLVAVQEQLNKYRVGVIGIDCDQPASHASCISEATLTYLLEHERERMFTGDFTKVYPTTDGAYFEPLLQYYGKLFAEKMDPEHSSTSPGIFMRRA